VKKLILCFVLVCVCATKTDSQQTTVSPRLALDTGNDLLTACTDENGFYNQACRSFIYGVISGYRLATEGLPSIPTEVKVCLPSGVTRGQVYDVVVKGLKDHPEARHEPSDVLIINAILGPWRCK
jgi:hypothetical protein